MLYAFATRMLLLVVVLLRLLRLMHGWRWMPRLLSFYICQLLRRGNVFHILTKRRTEIRANTNPISRPSIPSSAFPFIRFHPSPDSFVCSFVQFPSPPAWFLRSLYILQIVLTPSIRLLRNLYAYNLSYSFQAIDFILKITLSKM